MAGVPVVGEGECAATDDGWAAAAEPEPRGCDIATLDMARVAAGGGPSGRTLGRAFVREFASVDRPVLLRGLIGPAARAPWSRRALVERHSRLPRLRYQVMGYNGTLGEMSDAHTWRRASIGQWLDEMGEPPADGAPPGYVFDQSGEASAALAAPMAALFPWSATLAPQSPALYVGGNGSGNPFHYHQQTWNALVAGRKRWLLYAPRDAFYSELHPLEWLRRGSDAHVGSRA